MSAAWNEDVSAFAGTVVSATDTGLLTEAFQVELARYGLESFNCGEVDLERPRRTVFVVSNWPGEIVSFYEQMVRDAVDPTVEAIRARSTAFSWSELKHCGAGPKEQWLSQALRDFRWSEGFGIPIPRGGSRRGVVSLAGWRPPIRDEERTALSVISTLYYERVRGLLSARAPPWNAAGLARREIEALHWVASGLGDAATAGRMGIASSTAHFHVEAAKRKLGVRSRAEAVAIAVSLGLVTP